RHVPHHGARLLLVLGRDPDRQPRLTQHDRGIAGTPVHSGVPATSAAEVCAMDTAIELPGKGPWQRFIIKYRGDSAPGREPQVVQARLEQAAPVVAREGAPGLRLCWERRLGIGADVFEADRP